MTDSLSPIKLDEYINSIKNLEYRIRSIEDEMYHALDGARFYSEYTDAKKFVNEMQTYIYETQKNALVCMNLQINCIVYQYIAERLLRRRFSILL